MKRNTALVALVVMAWTCFCTAQTRTAATAKQASGPASAPSPEHPTGWRGDGSGIYPGANPPLSWSRRVKHPISKAACQAVKPRQNSASGDPIYRGVVHKWLVLGPIPDRGKDKPLEFEYLKDEAAIEPDAGQKSGDLAWKEWTCHPGNESLLNFGRLGVDFCEALNKPSNAVVYCHSYVFCPEACKVRVTCLSGAAKLWINGKETWKSETTVNWDWSDLFVELKAGWNRVMVKCAAKNTTYDGNWSTWKMSLDMTPPLPVSYESSNVRWITRLPGGWLCPPVIVGDRIFTSVEPYYLVCLDKKSGKILWIRANPPNEEKSEAQLKKLQEVNDKLVEQINAAISKEGPPSDKPAPDKALLDERGKIETELASIFKDVDAKNANLLAGAVEQNNEGWSVACPCSDGKYVYALYMQGVVACYDLAGKRVWRTYFGIPGNRHHGYSASPVLVDGTFIVNQGPVVAFDAKTGAKKWEGHTPKLPWGSLVRFKIGKDNAVITREGSAFLVADGKNFWSGALQTHAVDTAIFSDGVLYLTGSAYKVPDSTEGKLQTLYSRDYPKEESGDGGFGGCDSSPLLLDGIVYNLTENGHFLAFDAKTGATIYNVILQSPVVHSYVSLPGNSASLVSNGKLIFALNSCGVMHVIEPGRKFKEVARNPIDNLYVNQWGRPGGWEETWINPVLDGDCIYIRTPSCMYCIGK